MTTATARSLDALPDWRLIDGRLHAWFATDSHAAGAALLGAAVGASAGDEGSLADVDIRARGVRVRIGGGDGVTDVDARHAHALSTLAPRHGASAAPTALQLVELEVDSRQPESILPFWRTALGIAGDGAPGASRITDPLRRTPTVVLHATSDPRPLRDRIHVDVVRPGSAGDALTALTGIDPVGPWGVRHADADGNEIDMPPGDGLGTDADADADADAADWHTLFAAMVHYPTADAEQSFALARAAADLADAAGIPLMVDVRAGSVTIDGGKDRWEGDGGALPSFVALATAVQQAAHDLGLVADPTPLRFVQLAIDAVDVAAVRAFWLAALRAELDPRAFVTDIVDPLDLVPVLFFQEMAADDEPRRSQPGRMRLRVLVPADQVATRAAEAVAAGGRIVGDAEGVVTVVDPEGNAVTFASATS